jgi:hypothetical protein
VSREKHRCHFPILGIRLTRDEELRGFVLKMLEVLFEEDQANLKRIS